MLFGHTISDIVSPHPILLSVDIEPEVRKQGTDAMRESK